MLTFPFLQRRKKWIAVGTVVTVLPVVIFYVLETRREELIAGLWATNVRATPPVCSPLMKPVLNLCGVTPLDLPKLLWRISVPETVRLGSVSSSSEELNRAVDSLIQLGGVRSIEVAVQGYVFSPDAIRDLGRLHDLEELDVSNVTGMSDGSLAAISEIKSLRSLILVQGCNFTAKGIESLAALPALERLSIWTCLREPEITAISHLKTLRELDLGSSQFPDPTALRPLASLSNLERLQFSGNRKAISVISELKQLRELQMDEMFGLEADDLRPLAALPHLERLSVVNGTRQMESIDGSFERDLIPVFQSLKALKELRIGSRGGFPGNRVSRLRQALPAVKVVVIDTKADETYFARR